MKMAYKVLVVDDSSFFRRRVTDILNKDNGLTVIDVAVNGQEAVKKAIALKPDVITMDIEMPVLNGIDAVKEIMAKAPTAILMFSSLTHEGAKSTLEALDAGALDFLPKKFNEIASNSSDAGSLLLQRVLELAAGNKKSVRKTVNTSSYSDKNTPSISPRSLLKEAPVKTTISNDNNRIKSSSSAERNRVVKPNSALIKNIEKTSLSKSSGKKYKLLAIGTSTGGPVALPKVLKDLPENFPLPIVMVQHMPAAFTKAFADRLDSLCKITVKEACDGDKLVAGCAYLAPGGRQMLIVGTNKNAKIKILDDNSPRIAFKPSVDISFGSAAKVFGGDVLAIILTGMGSDGKGGSNMLKNKGAKIWSQNEESSVVYGMPQAVAVAGISELSLPIESFSKAILKEVIHG
jgi:two-component system chemotaxis response regulator CheB